MDLDLAKRLHRSAESKIVLLVADGLGGLPHPERGRSELETARTPQLDQLAGRSALGLSEPVGPGITPGSGPGHLSLFGYDPMQFDIGRGVLEAVGIDFAIGPDDVAARGNFCTLDGEGRITDRRAGRIASDEAEKLVERLRTISLESRLYETELFVEPVREHRFVMVLRGTGLSDAVTDTDPQRTGVARLRCAPVEADADALERAGPEATAALINDFADQAHDLLAGCTPANGLLLRGFSRQPSLPSIKETWGLRAASCAIYPMYRGLATLAGMKALPAGGDFAQQIAALRQHWDDYDFFFLHYKYTDSAGEDGDFDGKVARLEELDRHLPALLDVGADVLMIAGDHSTPATMAAHSWHPVPFLLHGPNVRFDAAARFTEADCGRGALGTFLAKEALPLAMAHAGRLAKYGA